MELTYYFLKIPEALLEIYTRPDWFLINLTRKMVKKDRKNSEKSKKSNFIEFFCSL